MAERSFKAEVEKLKLGAGREFRGEGILAVTKALLQSGVAYVSGYPFNYPQICAPMIAPNPMSVRRDIPRHMTVLPGGGSLALGKITAEPSDLGQVVRYGLSSE